MRNLYNNIADKTLSILGRSMARKALAAAALALIALASAPSASALPADTYAASSRLASGRWIQVSVTSSGMHKISDESLRAWGLNPAKTKVYGYGARRLPEELNSGYLDDLPQTPSEYVGGRGLFSTLKGRVHSRCATATTPRRSTTPSPIWAIITSPTAVPTSGSHRANPARPTLPPGSRPPHSTTGPSMKSTSTHPATWVSS